MIVSLNDISVTEKFVTFGVRVRPAKGQPARFAHFRVPLERLAFDDAFMYQLERALVRELNRRWDGLVGDEPMF